MDLNNRKYLMTAECFQEILKDSKKKKLLVEFFFAVEIHILYTVQSSAQYFDLTSCCAFAFL